MRWNKNKTIEVITCYNQLERWLPKLQQAEFLAYDTETTGLTRFSKIIGCSFSPSEDEGIYVVLKRWDKVNQCLVPMMNEEDEALSIKAIKALLQNRRNLLMHNAVYDAMVTDTTFGIETLHNVFCDTRLLAHTVKHEEGSTALKELATYYLDGDARNPENDMKASIIANGGRATKECYELYKADWRIIGKYACYDTIFTYGLFNRMYPEIDKQGLRTLWEKEVLPEMHVVYEMNMTGIRVDVPYFVNLRGEVQSNIDKLGRELYEIVKDKVQDFETQVVREKTNITAGSVLGRDVVNLGYAKIEQVPTGEILKSGKPKLKKVLVELPEYKKEIDNFAKAFYLKKEEREQVFNLNSSDHKGYLFYDVLKFPVLKLTKAGDKATDKKTLDLILDGIEEGDIDVPEESTDIINKLLDLNKERKVLTSYIDPILDNHINGILYASFDQAGTSSARLSCRSPLSFQTFPRKDKRIKKGIIPRDGNVFVAADYDSLEPHLFAFASGSPRLKNIFKDKLDFYSHLYIHIFEELEYSDDPNSPNYLKTKAPDKRDITKIFGLAVAYGLKEYKLSKDMKIALEKAKEYISRYFKLAPELKEFIEDSHETIEHVGFVTNLVGRRKRARIIPYLQQVLKTKTIDYKAFNLGWEKIKDYESLKDAFNHLPVYKFPKCAKDLMRAYNNELNNACNFQIQSLGASVVNAATIDYRNKRPSNLAKIILQIHDEIVIECPKDLAADVEKVLKEVMTRNWVTDLIDVPLSATPMITDKSLAEAK